MNDKLYNDELRKDTYFGLFPCSIVDVYEEDPYYLEVKLPSGVNILAKIVFTFPLVAVPNKTWLDTYKNSIYAWVGFERGLPEKPLLMGFSFKEGSEHNVEDYPFISTLISANYQIILNDKNDSLELKQLQGNKQSITILKDKIYLKSDNIHLGEETSKESAVLGEKLESLLNDLLDIMSKGKVATSIGPQLFMPDTQVKIQELKTKVKDIKSSINKLS